MVSNNIYPNMFLPSVKKYNIKPNNPNLKGNQTPVNLDAQSRKNSNQSEEVDNNRCINKFLNNESKEVNISDILKDFKSTMTAIGVPRSIGNGIMAQLKEVHVQASTANPSISHIQNGLCTAAESLDKFISDTLGKPSNVVKQWIDALLLQKVNYTAYDPISAKNSTASTSIATEKNKTEAISSTSQKPVGTNPLATIVPIEVTQQASTVNKSFEINNKEDIIIDNNSKSPEVKADFNLAVQTKALPMLSSSTEDTNQQNQTGSNLFKEARALYKKASQALLKGNKTMAIKYYNEAITVSKDLGDEKTHLKSLENLADIYDDKNDLKSALNNYNDALKLASTNDDTESMAKLHYNIASIYDDLNKVPQALKHYQASLSFDGELDNVDGQTLTLNNVASLYASINEHEPALEHYRIAYSLASQNNDAQAKGHILSNIGSVYQNMNEYSNAIEYFRRSLKADQECNNKSGYTQTLLNLAKVYEDTNQGERAKKCYKKAFNNARELNDKNLTAYLYNVLN